MNLEMQKGASPHEIEWEPWEITMCGPALDDRGQAVLHELTARGSQAVNVSYDPETFELAVGESRASADAAPDALLPYCGKKIVLEATTLGFAELLLCCRGLRENGIKSFDIMYVEPENYRILRRRHLLHRRDFELSSAVPGYQAIPGHGILLGDRYQQKGVFFLGYEEARLRRAFEDLQMIRASTSTVVFGVPAFKSGWEMDALANNIDVIREHNIRGGNYFCGAENPAAVIEVLTSIHQGLGPQERLYVAPIGTKPHGIGVALFVSHHREVGVIYDHPQRKRDRSSRITHWHRFAVRDYT